MLAKGSTLSVVDKSFICLGLYISFNELHITFIIALTSSTVSGSDKDIPIVLLLIYLKFILLFKALVLNSSTACSVGSSNFNVSKYFELVCFKPIKESDLSRKTVK